MELLPEELDAVAVQALGVIAFAFYMTATQMRTKRAIIRFNGIGGLFICANLYLLGGVLGGATALIAALRNLLITTSWGEKHRNSIIAFSLLLIIGLTCLLASGDWSKSFVILGPVFGSFAYIQSSMLKVRGFLFAAESTWLANALLFGSIGGILLGLATTSGHLVAIFRYSKISIMRIAVKMRQLRHMVMIPRPS